MADDKYILMGLNDNRSKDVAEVLKNKTCKKILDFLAETKEASEQDIAKGLKIPINTVEYNLRKLIKAGLAEKAKNFFWSTKGRKIDMYKLARKHIIISPSKKPNINYLKSILPAIFISLAVLILIIFMFPEQTVVEQTGLKQFSSDAELKNFLKENSESAEILKGLFGGLPRTGTLAGDMKTSVDMAESATAGASQEAVEYSTTNIQIEGVDEADMVKNDGKYIYTVAGNNVIIVNAYPAQNMEVLSEIEFKQGVSEIFINDDKLIVFSYQNIYIYDVSDRESPVLEQEIESDGNYFDSRMIGDYVYVISTKYARVNNPEPPVFMVGGVERRISAEEIYYFDYPDSSYVFTSIMAINIENGEINSEVYLTGSTRNIYVSQNNIYLTYQKRLSYETYAEDIAEQVYFPLLPDEEDEEIKEILASETSSYLKLNNMQKIVFDYSSSLKGEEKSDFDKELMESLNDFQEGIQKKMEKTVIHKIAVAKEDIKYKGVGGVPGNVLNQFSMDEYEGYFRIATTTGDTWRETSLNHLYVLDEDLKIVGSVEDLAKGERIYSVRFLGKRAYIVTFRQIDPFFVIDLENPREPEVLGYLKIPGYSSYLHPYDENHIIGLGKDGSNVKLSLFDVSDVENPEEIDKYIIKGDYSDSNALYDHKAFLFDKKKELLVIPVSYNEFMGLIEEEDYVYRKYKYWQGAFVFNIDLNGVDLRGKVSHKQNDSERGYYYGPYAVKRTLYMDNVLYTISSSKIKANDLETIEEINEVELPFETDYYPYPVFDSDI